MSKDSIFEHLEKVFDLMITFEFTENLKSILKMYGQDLTDADINQIIKSQVYKETVIPPKFTKVLVG
jgi:hypothetical protein